MRRKQTFCGLCVIFLISLPFIKEETIFRWLNYNKPDSFIVYYDYVNEDNIGHIASYDVAVLEPKGTTEELNRAIKEIDKTKIYGYMSTLQVEKHDEIKNLKIDDSDFLYVDGEKIYIEKYHDYLGDIRSESFRQVLLDIIEKRIVNCGYDGVFLDTVDYTEYFEDDNLNLSLQMGYIEFLKELKLKFPKLKLFQNRGFKSYFKGASKYVDILLYEDFRSDKIEKLEYYQKLVMDLNIVAKRDNVKIYALSSVNEASNRQYTKNLRWGFYFSSYEDNYLKINELDFDEN